MSNTSVSQHEPAWPRPNEEQGLQVCEHSCQDLSHPAKTRAGRPALVRWSHMCLAIMICCVRGWNAHVEGWRLRLSERLGACAPVNVSDHAISNRIEHAATPLHWRCDHVSVRVRAHLAPWEDHHRAPWATAVSAADASTLDQVSRVLPWVRTRAAGDPRVVAGQINAVCDVRLHPWVRVDCWSNAADQCTRHVLTFLERVHAGTVLLCDRGSFSVAFCDQRSARGIWGRSRDAHQASSQVSPICAHADGIRDAIVSLGTSSSTQARSPVRLVHVWLHGRHARSLTNGRDPHVLPLADVVRLSARRWEIELAFRALTDHLHLHHLWSAPWDVVHVHLWWCLILAQVSHALQVEMAGHAGVEVCDGSLDLLIRLTPGWLSRGLTPFAHAVCCGRDVRVSRPSTRHHIAVPWMDPSWGVPPPPEAVHPRETVRSRSQTTATRSKSTGLVRLHAGTLSVLE